MSLVEPMVALNLSPTSCTVRPQTLVLGLGNELLSDDGVGFAVVRAVSAHCTRHDVVCLQSSAVGWALLDEILGFESVIVVDAIVTGMAAPGHVHEIDAWQIPSQPISAPHRVGLPEALKLATLLGLPLPRYLKIFALEIRDSETFSNHFSPAVAAAVPAIAVRVLAEIENLSRHPRP